jgi:serine/threonine protein kinase
MLFTQLLILHTFILLFNSYDLFPFQCQEESKLYIFIELVTQGSLSSLYQKYKLQESQVSAYTRQILNGLLYLHERNVVHRYKAAHILILFWGHLMLTIW